MNRKALIIALVAAAVVLVLLLKPGRGPTPAADATTSATAITAAETKGSVLLFADMREVGSSCGCGTVIEMVREANRARGVSVSEHDIRDGGQQAKARHVRINPTVIIVGADGIELSRFEGESPAVIERLGAALGAIGQREDAR